MADSNLFTDNFSKTSAKVTSGKRTTSIVLSVLGFVLGCVGVVQLQTINERSGLLYAPIVYLEIIIGAILLLIGMLHIFKGPKKLQ